jgi:hypothetical protein
MHLARYFKDLIFLSVKKLFSLIYGYTTVQTAKAAQVLATGVQTIAQAT